MKRSVIIVAAVWALVVAGLALYSVHSGRPTTREQTTIADALPTVDSAFADMVAALDPAASVALLAGYRRVGRDCSVTAVRDGARYERSMQVYTREGGERAQFDRLVARLPGRYRARVSGSAFTAEPGNFVGITGAVTGPGQLRLVVDTGCRAQDEPIDGAPRSAPPRDSARAALDALGLTASGWRSQQVPCPGGTLSTVDATVSAGGVESLPDRLRGIQATEPILAQNDTFAYRAGSDGVVVRLLDGNVMVAATTGCG